jgi:hypothetical protein
LWKEVFIQIFSTVSAYFFLNFELSNVSGHREESLWGGGNGRKGTASSSFICWFLMIGLSFFGGVVDWLKVLLSFYGFMLKLYDFLTFISCFFVVKRLGIRYYYKYRGSTGTVLLIFRRNENFPCNLSLIFMTKGTLEIKNTYHMQEKVERIVRKPHNKKKT